jgi:drug/metabolite transporter (DMT)-like permease
MLALMLGLLVAIGYGAADFLGGLATRRLTEWTVLLGTNLTGLAVGAGLAAVGGGHLTATDAAWSAAAGVAIMLGLACLFRGIASGAAGTVAPIAAVGATSLQIVVGLLRGERPGAVALVGAAVALVAVVLVAADPGGEVRVTGRDVLLGVGAAVGLGISLVLFTETSKDAGLWPVVVARAAALPVVALLLLARRERPRGLRPQWRTVVSSGALDAVSNALLLLAVRRAFLSVVAPVAALAPAVTVLLARAVLKERVGGVRGAGLVVASVGLVLMALR